MNPNPVLSALGYDASARLVIFHADDVGMCHGSNQAFLDLQPAGIVRTGSVMVPCPWAPEILHRAAAQPELDLGLHLTLTSEWDDYRWGPISTRQANSGLLDEEGYFWHRTPQVMTAMKPLAAITEMQAQAQAMHRAGVDFTHIDTHMGVAMTPPLIEAYVELGFRWRVPVLLPRQADDYMRALEVAPKDEVAWQRFLRSVEERGMPLVDWFRITPGYDFTDGSGDRAELYEALLRDLQPGITYFSLHPNAPGDIETITPDKAHWRTFEYEYFRSERLRSFLDAEGIVPIGYRELRERMKVEG